MYCGRLHRRFAMDGVNLSYWCQCAMDGVNLSYWHCFFVAVRCTWKWKWRKYSL